MNYIKYLQNAGTITYANESRMPGYSHRNWYGGLVSGINGSRYSVHPGVYNFYTNEDGSISWGKRTGHIVKGSDGKQYVDFEVDPNSTARPELKTYQRFELGLTAQKPQTPIVKQATEQEIIDHTLRKASTSVPIQNLATQSNQQAVIKTQKQPVQQQPAQKPVTPKSNTVAKQPVPQNLLPYIANVTSDGVALFNIPDGYTKGQFEEAINAVYQQNKWLAQKPMIYYEQPQQQIQQQQQQQQAVQQSQKQYQAQRQQIAQQSQAQKQQTAQQPQTQKQQNTYRQNIKYINSNNKQTVEVPVENTGEPDLVTEVFAYPSRQVDVYNIHPEAYQKVLEYLNNNFKKTKTNNKPDKYILSLSGFKNVPIGGEVNDSIFHYISKDGEHEQVYRFGFNNANIINKNESISSSPIFNDIITNNGKLKMYSYSNGNDVYFKNSNGVLLEDPFKWNEQESVMDLYTELDEDQISYLRDHGFNEQQIKDFINKNKNLIITKNYNVDRSMFRLIKKQQPVQNNSSQQTKGTSNIVQKAKQAGKKVLSFLGFQNGGTLNYLNYIN